jgi:hypothetical protein
MATGVARIPRPRHGVVAPLSERWAAASARLRKLCPRGHGALGQPMTELALDAIEDAIHAHTPVPAAIEPALRAIYDELNELQHRYHRAWASIRKLQQRLPRLGAAASRIHQLLGDIPSDAHNVFPEIDLGVRSTPDFRSVAEGRRYVQAFLPKVLEIEGRQAQLDAVLSVGAEAPEELNRKLIWALYERVLALEATLQQQKEKRR